MASGFRELAGIAASERLKRGASVVRAILRGALDLALPRLCAACREPVDGQGLCPACWSKLSFITRPYCERLGIPFVYDPGPGILSMEAIADPPAYRRARAAVRFDDISRALVHALKYGDRLDLAPMMGRWLGQAGRELLAEADALVPVPLHWRRQWARRFNQSAMLAAAVSTASGVPVAAGVLKRVKPTAQQVGLSRSERAPTCRAPSACRRKQKPPSPAAASLSSTTCSPRARPSRAAPRRSYAPAPPTSTCWFSPGLPRAAEHPYKELINLSKVANLTACYGFCRNLH